MVPRGIVFHLSASSFGDAAQINQWHLARGWSGIGYHFVILNGRRYGNSSYDLSLDGIIENGRPENLKGAHCLANSMNTCTIGICSIGNPGHITTGTVLTSPRFVSNPYLTSKQFDSLINKAVQLCLRYELNPAGYFRHPTTGLSYPVISQHSQHERVKPLCASLNITDVREAIVCKYKSFARDLDSKTASDDAYDYLLLENPEAIERSLPEFQFPHQEGPMDLEADVNLEAERSTFYF